MTGAARNSGFTLIELLVSTTILALVMGLVAFGTQVMSQGWSRGGEAAAVHNMLARANDILRRDLAGARRIVIGQGTTSRFVFDGRNRSMTYVVEEPPYPTAAGIYAVRLAIRRRGGTTRLVRSRKPFHVSNAANLLASEGSTEGYRDAVILAKGTFKIAFGYHGGGGAEGWQSESRNPRRMPSLVRISFLNHDNRRVYPDIIARLNIAAEVGCASPAAGPCTIATEGELRRSSRLPRTAAEFTTTTPAAGTRR